MIIDKPVSGSVGQVNTRGSKLIGPLPLFLAFKEIWRNKGRFLLFSLVIALITTLVLFIAGLAEGLGAGNREYLEKLNADLILFQEDVDLSIPSSRFDRSTLNNVQRVEGVAETGSIGFSNSTIPLEPGQDPLKISLIGVEPGQPGEPPAFEGRGLMGKRDNEAILDKNAALRTGLEVGDTFSIKSVQGTEEKLHPLTVAGISDGRQYSLQPSVFVPYLTWEDIRPKSNAEINQSDLIFNLVATQLENPDDLERMSQRLEDEVSGVEAVDRQTAYESSPGYRAQQSTLNTQRIFSLVIGVLVIGGFFTNPDLTESGSGWDVEGHRHVKQDHRHCLYCPDCVDYSFWRGPWLSGNPTLSPCFSCYGAHRIHPADCDHYGCLSAAHRPLGGAGLAQNFAQGRTFNGLGFGLMRSCYDHRA
jgi:putative ABC transport system permease protein